ncbi:MoaD/ThiS family protein [Candidatus Contubernalis alkaliaceticus]|uniref:MoaD/ThiS family protein n=1 Tax=Candidatus Contubernalis alkaliaceticus TaxID=338645 RepID=UPI001F4C0E98|nr:MoaD/ThiS family protein [Candidatus Contubernalis alkalaceticus]UNC91012.1 MoaD/ThiS family protein [Candidatus Contubernalis alkalaceticus]
MQITVKLFATLREGRFKVSSLEVEAETPLAQVADQLKIPREELALILVNGRDASLDHVMKEGDTLSLFPPVGGG